VPQPRRKSRSDHEHTRAIIRPERASRSSRWMLWSTLLKRVFEVDGFECPLCDQPMRLQAVVLPPAAAVCALRWPSSRLGFGLMFPTLGVRITGNGEIIKHPCLNLIPRRSHA
jgi:hypothetical protein